MPLAVLVTLLATLWVAPVAAQEEPAEEPAEEVPGLSVVPAPESSRSNGLGASGRVVGTADALRGLPVVNDGAGVVWAMQEDAQQEVDAARSRHDLVEAVVVGLNTTLAEQAGEIGRLNREIESSETEHAALGVDLRAMAVSRYMSDGDFVSGLGLSPAELDDRSRGNVLSGRAMTTSVSRLEAIETRIRSLRDDVDSARDERDTTLATADSARARFGEAQLALSGAVEHQRNVDAIVDDPRSQQSLAGSDIGLVALDAYWRAAHTLRAEDPGCGLDWWGLAGVGKSESGHGTFAGAAPLADGTVSIPIIGIALNGENSTRAIGDTDGGVLDGDEEFDRAVGPMQFIPGTWNRWGRDGSGDGIIDPQNMYDAALAAADYLCSGAGGLETDDGLLDAYLRYNNSQSYTHTVLSYARWYELLPVPSA